MLNLLSFDSVLADHPHDINIKLKNHQLAMLKKCKDIEKIDNNIFGIMNDKPATGKTYVVLSLIYDTKSPNKTNIIIVPQNIYTQWIISIENFSKNLTYKKFINYENIMALYNDPTLLLNNDIILTTSSYYHNIATTLESLNINVHRVFFDEIDSISNIIRTKINSDFIWFISASFNKESLGYYKNKIDMDNMNDIVCKCDNEFIDVNILLDNPTKQYYLCKNIYIDNILENVLSEKELLGLNAMDYTFNKQKAKNEKEVIEILLKNRKSFVEFEKFKKNDAKIKIDFYEDFKKNIKLHEDVFLENIDKLSKIYDFKSNILNFLSDYYQNTEFYINIFVEDKDGEKIIKEARREEIKTLRSGLEDILEILYNINEIDNICNDYINRKTSNSSVENTVINLKQLIIMMNNIYDIIFKMSGKEALFKEDPCKEDPCKEDPFKEDPIKEDPIKENPSNIILFYNNFIDTKKYINELIILITNFENAQKAENQLSIYNKITEVTEKNIIENELKIDLIYKRLEENNCCPVCYDLFNDIESNKIYITSTCCNNKICENCIEKWYNKDKLSCILCNLENISKESLLFYEKDCINNNLTVINEKLIEENNINFELLGYGKNIFLKNFISKLKDEDKKIIIFSDYSNIFQYIETICIDNEISYIDLDKGNIKDIDKVVYEYKFGNAKILLSNSTLFGCGMNFENSTDIIFVHKMNDSMEKQVIGRAQRMGRKNRLNIIYLQYENESEYIIKNIPKSLSFLDNIDENNELEEFYNEKIYCNVIDNIQNLNFEVEDFSNEIINMSDATLVECIDRTI